jgi:hypothetical protein
VAEELRWRREEYRNSPIAAKRQLLKSGPKEVPLNIEKPFESRIPAAWIEFGSLLDLANGQS